MAPKKAREKIRSWSPTNLGLYEECPRRAYYKLVERLPEPPQDPNGPLARGTRIHEAAEGYITSRVPKLDPDLKNKKVKKILDNLKAEYKNKKVRVEMMLAFDKNWKVTGWTSSTAYCRFKVDAIHFVKDGRGIAYDWKTGRFKPEGKYDDQVNSYAVAVLSTGLLKEVTSKLVFTDHGEEVDVPAGHLRESELKKAQQHWDKKAKAMLSDTRFSPRPGNACRWCPYSANVGGPCEY